MAHGVAIFRKQQIYFQGAIPSFTSKVIVRHYHIFSPNLPRFCRGLAFPTRRRRVSRTRLSHFPFTFHFHALEKEMATHSSVLAWRIPGTREPGGLPSMGSHRVGHNWSDSSSSISNQETVMNFSNLIEFSHHRLYWWTFQARTRYLGIWGSLKARLVQCCY